MTPIASGDVFPRTLETGPEGTTFLAWGDYGGSSTTLRGALAPPGGLFGAPITIATDVGSFATALAPGGNVLAAWGREVAAQDQRLMVGGIDSGASPSFGVVDVPATALVGSQVTLSASAADWSGLREIRWTLSDGAVLTGGTVRHAFAAAGTTSVQITAVDRAGNQASVSREIRVVGESPSLAAAPLRLDRTKPKLRLRAPSKMKLRTFLRGVRVRMHLDEPSRVAVQLLARARSAHISAKQNLILVSRQLESASGERVIRLRPNRHLLGGARRFRVAVRVTAIDAAGNQSVRQHSIRVG